MADQVKAALRSLTRADEDAIEVLRIIRTIPEMRPPRIPNLRTCRFRTTARQYTGRMTAEQCARIREVSGQSPSVVEKKLLKLLQKVRYAVGVLTDGLADLADDVVEALRPQRAHFKLTANVPDSLGRCIYIDSNNQANCVDMVLRADCTRLGSTDFLQGQPCLHPGRG